MTNPNIVVGAPSIVVAPKQQQQLQLQHEKRQHSFCRALKVATDLHAEVSMHALAAQPETRLCHVSVPWVMSPCMLTGGRMGGLLKNQSELCEAIIVCWNPRPATHGSTSCRLPKFRDLDTDVLTVGFTCCISLFV